MLKQANRSIPMVHKLLILALVGWFIAIAVTSRAMGAWNDPVAAAILIIGFIGLILYSSK